MVRDQSASIDSGVGSSAFDELIQFSFSDCFFCANFLLAARFCRIQSKACSAFERRLWLNQHEKQSNCRMQSFKFGVALYN